MTRSLCQPLSPPLAALHSDIPLVTPAARGGVKVPPPNMKPTAALRIDNFMRPFTLPQVRQPA